MAWPRSPSLPWISVAVNPAESVGTRNAVTPSSVRAKVSATSARVPLVMNILLPDSTQSSPSRVARVRSEPASDPVSGSVRAKQPSASPAVRRGSHRCFCSSPPCARIVLATRPSETDTMPRTAESPRPSSSVTRTDDTMSASTPP